MSATAVLPTPAATVQTLAKMPEMPKGFLAKALAPFLAAASAWALWTLPDGLAAEGRVVMIVTVLAVIGWTLTRIPESLVALAAAMALVMTGTIGEDRFYATLGSDLVWLLLAAFIIAAIIKEAGLAERLVAPLTACRPRFGAFAFALAGTIALTALILPSTSGRAALLLPVFLALLPLLPDARLARALALLFPTVILLSAGGSLIGAGAHLIAVEAMVITGAPRLGYLDWLMLGGPLAVIASAAAVVLILWLFVPRDLWAARMAPAALQGPRSVQQSRILFVIAVLVALWMTEPMHGLGMSLVAMLGALALLTRPFTSRKTKDVFRSVDIELILYLAATMLMAEAMTTTGADRWLASKAMATLPPSMLLNGPGVAIALSIIAVLAHLVIASRSARAAILIPAVALPMAGLGHDATLMILIAVMGTGFCQTLMSSAKPVAIYGLREEAGFTQTDLLRLALPLGVVKTALLIGFAVFVWPQQVSLSQPQPLVLPPVQTLPSDLRTAIAAMPDLFPANPAAILSASPRPLPRPDAPRDLERNDAVGTQDKSRRVAAKPGFGAQFKRDVNSAVKQLRRDLRGLFN